MPVDEQGRTGVMMFAEITGPDDHKELGCCTPEGGRKEYVWNLGDSQGLCPVMTIKRHLYNHGLESPWRKRSRSSHQASSLDPPKCSLK